ncbi:uncharacterized protein K460DRAFT_347785 [Cucurbitaria berberidis CBS 394.84]|uniref:Rhodopsin domain-containing protein n=1 Tax=Cucurbitaria berberidis CBS 394.84 TaxID=1168544 RepID=A0A9P4L4P7_9PLEO|nr:uncharacterized protein K460DRAFT_347785 [Cucurbitaria berberidis CBS 394.84]KAF1841118.1 hypothetical protein K460DRAFT_347785 [Cucurbitaria berberidis CBS 394.84]
MGELTPEQIARLREQNLGPQQFAIVVVFTLLALITVCLRVYTRMRLVHLVGLEDYFIVLSMCLSLCTGIFQCLQVKWGRGTHTMFLKKEQIGGMLKYIYLGIVTYNLGLAFTRISILLSYRRIFTSDCMRISVKIALSICTVWGFAAVVIRLFSCIPINALWDISKKPIAKCFDEKAFFILNAGINIATNLTVAILPIKAIWNLRIPRGQRTVLVANLSIGWFICIVSGIRLQAFLQAFKHPLDRTFYDSITICWTAIELNLAIACACIPSLKALLKKILS